MSADASGPVWRLARRAGSAGLLAVVLFAAWWLWPVRLGGGATVIVVEGHSMEPTYHSGDLVVARRQSGYRPGEIVVFALTPPGSDRRALVVHRLKEIGADGRITTQGDNREHADGFELTTDDIVGRAQVRVPHGGAMLFLLSRWWVLASAVGLLVTTMLWPRSADPEIVADVVPPEDDPKDDDPDVVLAELDALLDEAIRALAEQGLGV